MFKLDENLLVHLSTPSIIFLGVEFKGVKTSGDCNDFYSKGKIQLYEFRSGDNPILNAPAGWGCMLAYSAGSSCNQLVQLYIGMSGIKYRYKDGNSNWNSWT